MATSVNLPMGQMAEVLESAREADRERLEHIELAILVDPEAARPLVISVRDVLLPVHSNSAVRVQLLGDAVLPLYPRPDLCVVVSGGSDGLVKEAATSVVRQGVPVAIVAESVLDVPSLDLPEHQVDLVTSIFSVNEAVRLAQLSHWMISSTEKSTAIASNFPFCRRARVSDLMRDYANKNAVVGAIGSRGGSDLVAMTSNQARLALDIAASYGRSLSMQRVQELVGVVTAGVGYRAVARSATSVLPGLSWALNAGVGYLGTVATANAIASHYEREDAGERPLPRLRALAESIGTLMTSRPSLYVIRALGEGMAVASGELDEQ